MSNECAYCGMCCKPNDYHPFAACMMFKQCKNGNKVEANLKAVVEHGRKLGLQDAAEREREMVEALRLFRHKRHRHVAVEADSVGDECAVCGKDIRHDIHYRLEESAATDQERARKALAAYDEREGEK